MKKRKPFSTTRQDFLLSFFDGEGYQELNVNGFWLVKHHDGNTGGFVVAIYTQQAFLAYKQYIEGEQEKEQQENHVKSIAQSSLLDRILSL